MNKTPQHTSHKTDQAVPKVSGTVEQSDEGDSLDPALVARAQKGDTHAYDELVLRHRNRIHAMIYHMTHNDADAWDLSQEVFIKAWNALPAFEAKAKFSTWLYRIAHNVVYDWNRRRKMHVAGELNDEILESNRIDPAAMCVPSIGESPDDSMDHGELRKKIEQALSKLTPDHKQIILLKDVQGLSYKEIADVMHCTIGTVMSRLFYARQKLQTLLKDEYESR